MHTLFIVRRGVQIQPDPFQVCPQIVRPYPERKTNISSRFSTNIFEFSNWSNWSNCHKQNNKVVLVPNQELPETKSCMSLKNSK